MWFERFVIIVTTLVRDFVPANWGYFSPTVFDVLVLIGSFGLFLTLFLLFCRFLPIIALSEVKGVMPDANPHYGHDDHSPAEGEEKPMAVN
jgi:molybdopterin-containing oxidoreductase family membrane subunit